MVESILVPMDGSPKSKDGLEHALKEHSEGDVLVLHVMTPFEEWETENDRPTAETIQEWYERSQKRSEEIFAEAKRIAADYDSEVNTQLEVGEPWREIVSVAEENDVDIIVMGSHGRDDGSSLPMGSVAETVMRRSPALVSVVR
ncbi:universal stress protein [Natronomonas salina]|uniref:universal stress protein n=1 Tax=Natronomonas salina TaxID=1710540 RepID=UPI0015B76753|nr:universal stress protein [Natronomonas salina]QLD89572.1 universal stress protein [Natronomonas salina]